VRQTNTYTSSKHMSLDEQLKATTQSALNTLKII